MNENENNENENENKNKNENENENVNGSVPAATADIPRFPDKALGLLGLCRRSGRVILGAGRTLDALTGGRPPRLVIVAADASARTSKQLRDKCASHGVRITVTSLTSEKLAKLMGSNSPAAAAAACDGGLTDQMIRLTDAENDR